MSGIRGSRASSSRVVTSDYHTRRARWAVRHVLQDLGDQVCLVSAPSERFAASDWWRRETGFVAIAGENLKLAGYVLGSMGPISWTAAALVAAALLLTVSRRFRQFVLRPLA